VQYNFGFFLKFWFHVSLSMVFCLCFPFLCCFAYSFLLVVSYLFCLLLLIFMSVRFFLLCCSVFFYTSSDLFNFLFILTGVISFQFVFTVFLFVSFIRTSITSWLLSCIVFVHCFSFLFFVSWLFFSSVLVTLLFVVSIVERLFCPLSDLVLALGGILRLVSGFWLAGSLFTY